MKVRAVRIAAELGISKATVSLALNNRPGVSSETRRRVLACKERLEKEEKKNLLVIKAIKGLNIIYNAEIDLWTDVLAVFEREARKKGYMTSVAYVDMRKDSVGDIVHKCNTENIQGVFLVATELSLKDIECFEKIKKPMVIYDNESPGYRHYSIVPDNYRGVETAVNYFFEHNYHDIVYFANDQDIYNFRERRKAFCNMMAEHNMNPYEEGRIVSIGTTIHDVYQKSLNYLDSHKLPEACLMENYQVSIGMTRAMRERGIEVPWQVGLIGIDVVPDYLTGNYSLTVVRIPHTDRAVMSMLMLEKEMQEYCEVKARILTDCRLVEKGSIMEKKYIK